MTDAEVSRHEVIAHNTAVASENRIHDDEVARRYGFAGGLVPGVDVYAYLTHPVVEAWGERWLRSGSADVRFDVPVYDGRLVRIEPEIDGDGVAVRAIDDDGRACAVARLGFRHRHSDLPHADSWAVAPVPAHRPDASPNAFAAIGEGGALPTLRLTLTPEDAVTYLEGVRESLPIYRGDDAPAHPGWLLRRANDALAGAVRLGPWIHVASTVHHNAVVRLGDTVEVRSRLVRWWEAGGHRFVDLDVALVVGDDLCARIDHTAIYRPRPAR